MHTTIIGTKRTTEQLATRYTTSTDMIRLVQGSVVALTPQLITNPCLPEELFLTSGTIRGPQAEILRKHVKPIDLWVLDDPEPSAGGLYTFRGQVTVADYITDKRFLRERASYTNMSLKAVVILQPACGHEANWTAMTTDFAIALQSR